MFSLENVMTDTTTRVHEHYGVTDLTDRIKSALATIVPEDQKRTVAQLAPLDQFHTRGILATTELADAAELAPSARVLDFGLRHRRTDTSSGRNLRL
jgi:hypothetical protein